MTVHHPSLCSNYQQASHSRRSWRIPLKSACLRNLYRLNTLTRCLLYGNVDET